MATLRLASYNLLHGLDVRQRGRLDLAAVAECIRALDADVVCVQEADRGLPRSGGVDQVVWLAERLGYQAAFAPALLGDPDSSWRTVPGAGDPGGPAYGVGLLSRAGLEGVRRIALPGGGDGQRPTPTPQRDGPPSPGWDHEPRVGLAATVAGGLEVATTHLSYLFWRAIAQARVLLESAGRDGPAAVLGDLNLPAWGGHLLAGRAPPVGWLLSGFWRPPPGWRHGGGAATYPAWEPRLQLDQLLVRGPVAVRWARPWGRGSSDHLPLVAEVAFTP